MEAMAKQEAHIRISSGPGIVPQPSAVPDLSICIVNWNCSDYLRGLLKSIRSARDDLAVEIIVVDNASTDESATMVEAEFREVRLLRNQHHQGVAKANNQAAAQARGKMLLFLNNDTRIRPGGLTTLVHFFEQHPELSAVGPSVISIDGKLQGCVRKTLRFRALLHRVWLLRWTRFFRSAYREYQQVDFDLRRSACVKHLVGPALLVRRQQFMSIGGWDEGFEFRMDDVDLATRLSRLGEMYYLADAQVLHWGGIATELDPAYAYCSGECSYVHFIRKHYGPWAARCYKLFVTADMPARVFVLAASWIVAKVSGSSDRATRNYGKLATASHFLTRELPRYWRS
jgi:N-acetylglucosaminyl-diphospho-decaprenol L-rhamnosyltransferase